MIPTPAKRRRSGLSMNSKRSAYYAEKREGEEEDEEADEEDDFQPSEGSENEMETEMLDYM